MRVKPEPDVRKSRKVAHTLWDMAKNKIDSKQLETSLTEAALKTLSNNIVLDTTNGLKDIFEEMKKSFDVPISNVTKLSALWKRVHDLCLPKGPWCSRTEKAVEMDTTDAPVNQWPKQINNFINTATVKQRKTGGAGKSILFHEQVEELFVVNVIDVTVDASNNKIEQVTAHLSLRTEFIRGLENCIESDDDKTRTAAYKILNYYQHFSAYSHMKANQAITNKHTLYDKYTDVQSFHNKLVLYNSKTGEGVIVKDWLNKSSDNLIFTLNMTTKRFQQSKKVQDMRAGVAFNDIESVGFASDWSTVRSSIPYVECLNADQPMNKIMAGHHNMANYRLRQHMNTGDRQFLLCIKERHGLKLVVFLSETLFMKLAVMKHNNHPGQIIQLDTYIYENQRYDHPIENSLQCTSREGQIVLIATDFQTMTLQDTTPQFTTRDHLQKVLGVDDHGVMLHQIYQELTKERTNAGKEVKSILDNLKTLIKDGAAASGTAGKRIPNDADTDFKDFEQRLTLLHARYHK